jgi:hypothetical protein
LGRTAYMSVALIKKRGSARDLIVMHGGACTRIESTHGRARVISYAFVNGGMAVLLKSTDTHVRHAEVVYVKANGESVIVDTIEGFEPGTIPTRIVPTNNPALFTVVHGKGIVSAYHVAEKRARRMGQHALFGDDDPCLFCEQTGRILVVHAVLYESVHAGVSADIELCLYRHRESIEIGNAPGHFVAYFGRSYFGGQPAVTAEGVLPLVSTGLGTVLRVYRITLSKSVTEKFSVTSDALLCVCREVHDKVVVRVVAHAVEKDRLPAPETPRCVCVGQTLSLRSQHNFDCSPNGMECFVLGSNDRTGVLAKTSDLFGVQVVPNKTGKYGKHNPLSHHRNRSVLRHPKGVGGHIVFAQGHWHTNDVHKGFTVAGHEMAASREEAWNEGDGAGTILLAKKNMHFSLKPT